MGGVFWQCSALQFSTVHHSSVQCITVNWSTKAVQFLALPSKFFLQLPSPVFSEICWLLGLVKWEILPVLASWKLSGVGVKPLALGPPALGPRALLANIPTPLNFQVGNTDTVQCSTVLWST